MPGRRKGEPQEAEYGPDEMDDDEVGPRRRCFATGAVKPAVEMIRFVVAPEGVVVPDIEAKLPGRGFWLSARRDVVNTASAKGLFAKAARRRVAVPDDLADRIERLLLRRCLDLIGLARRAGHAVVGFEKVRGELKAGRGAVVLAAADGAADGREKIRAIAGALPVVSVLRSDELGAAFGRDHAVHALLAPGRLAEGLLVEAGKLADFRAG